MHVKATLRFYATSPVPKRASLVRLPGYAWSKSERQVVKLASLRCRDCVALEGVPVVRSIVWCHKTMSRRFLMDESQQGIWFIPWI